MGDYSLNKITFLLQNSTTSLDDKIRCLRYIKDAVSKDTINLDVYHRQGLNQLILDNALKMILNDDRSIGVQKRQLVRTELFIILADMLGSDCLFGGIREQLSSILSANDEKDPNLILRNEEGRVEEANDVSQVGIQSAPLISSSLKSANSSFTDPANSIKSADSKISLLKPLISLQIRKRATLSTLSKSLKPRPSVIFEDKYEPNYFVPGANPYDFLEQDRKLGYQKSRMWFPAAKADVAASLIPFERSAIPKKTITERITQEFLQMRALVSYVGDNVIPFNAKTNSSPNDGSSSVASVSSMKSNTSSTSISATVQSVKRLSGFMEPVRYDFTVEEALKVWNPLYGIQIPEWTAVESIQKTAERQFDRLAPYRFFAPSKITKFTDSVDSKVIDDSLEIISIADTIRPEKEENDSVLNDVDVDGFQENIAMALEEQMRNVSASIKLSEDLIARTIKSQYALFPQKFLRVIEGGKADVRGKVAKAFLLFCRTKRLNYLALAMGIWKITLLQKASEEKWPIYCKTAATYLIFSWATNFRKKNLTKWIQCWRGSVGRCIFLQRNAHAIVIQTLYRTWRDRRSFIRMHNVAHFNGILSDIYLAPQRKNVLFFIPHAIRNTRRMYWLAARNIQTRFRCWSNGREYKIRRRRILLLQSMLRMFPIRKKFLRLKFWTIKCQAWARRTIQRNRFKILKRAAITIQKYTRRYLGQLLKWRRLDVIWRAWEKRMTAAIIIQQRWFVYKAKKTVRKILLQKAMEQWAALVIQRNYFRMKRAFHTFFLTCVYRIREVEDKKLDKLATTMGRFKASRLLVRRYRLRYFKRNISAVVRVQCWFRGRLGYTTVTILRRYRWAHRKLYHWARGMLRKKNAFVRTIQRWWWRLKNGRLLRHLWHRAYLKDVQNIKMQRERRHHAASKIQAYVKGIWDRRWVKRHRAALKIQKNWKFLFGIKKMKRIKADKVRQYLRKYVQSCVDVAVKNRTLVLVKLHSIMLIKPQSLIRGFIIRSIMIRARLLAYEIGMAAITIQRYWRKAGAVAQAVEEVMAAKRLLSNPFRECTTTHDVLLLLRKYASTLYDSEDPRVGMKISTLLSRIGQMELMEMFPKKEYVYVADLRKLTIEKMVRLYDSMQARNQKKKQKKDSEDSAAKQPKKRGQNQKSNAPVQVLQTILKIAQPPLFTRNVHHLMTIRVVGALTESFSPQSAFLAARDAFIKKFGKTLQARANNVAREFVNMAFVEYNNFKCFDTVTFAQYTKTIAICSESSQMISNLGEVRSKNTPSAEDKRWDKERVAKCAELLQLAVDSIGKLLPHGYLRDMLEKAHNRMISYKRKFEFTRKRFKAQMIQKQKKKNTKQSSPVKSSKNNNSPPVIHNHLKTCTPLPPISDEADVNNIPRDLLSTFESIDLPFNGSLEDFDLEFNISLCKIYFEAIHKIYTVSYGVQNLKNAWSNKAMRRAVRKEMINRFLAVQTDEYFKKQKEDHVKLTWNRIRKKDTRAKKLAVIINSVREKRIETERYLKSIVKYGWVKMSDVNGYSYWADMGIRSKDPQNIMPTYSLDQWYATIKIQRVARRYNVFQKFLREQRERDAQLEIQRAHDLLAAESIRAETNRVHLTFKVITKYLDVKKNKNVSVTPRDVVPTLEELLPWRCRFEARPIFTSGSWALLKQGDFYEIVVIFKLRREQGKELCSARSVKGKKYNDVLIREVLFQMNMDVDTDVEARYKNKKLFYRSKISKVIDSGLSPRYSVTYEDGEIEENLGREHIRPTRAAVEAFLISREEYLRNATVRRRRLEHFATQKQNRTSSFYSKITSSENTGTKTFIKVSFKYLRRCLRYGWSRLDPLQQRTRHILKEDSDKVSDGPTYINDFTSETSETAPTYSMAESFSAQRIQSAWYLFKAQKLFKKAIAKLSLSKSIQDAIRKCASIAFIGYQFEGATILHLLRRTGSWDIAEALEAHCKAQKKDLNSFTLESIVQKSKEEFVAIGVNSATQIRTLKDLQLWWKRTSAAEREKKMAFFNSYASPTDPRDIKQCILDSEDFIYSKFSKVITTGSTRTRAACKSIVTDSIYPHSHQQIDAYLKKYADKPELARESISELINKRTTNTWVEEAKVYKKFRHVSFLIGAVLKSLKLRKLYKTVFTTGLQAESIAKNDTIIDASRPNCSGQESKAALLLRGDVLEIVYRYIKSSILIQKVFRRHFLSSKWRVLLKRRVQAVAIIQRCSRRKLAYMRALELQYQRESEWEQLWNPAKSLLYYYNYVTKKSQYFEPDGPFRPLVRDKKSAALMQAWPEIDNHRGVHALLPGVSRPVVPGVLCGICNTRRCIRECLNCVSETYYDVNTQVYVFPYCFPCFVKEHGDSGDNADHEFIVLEGASEVPSLLCCLCNEPSTRKCMGPLDEHQVDEICSKLKKTKLNKWKQVLADSNVGGERKINLLLDQFYGTNTNKIMDGSSMYEDSEDDFGSLASPTKITATSAQLESIRAVLEQMRAECDECYCASCYEEVHSGGRRREHKWKGHKKFCAICTVCGNSAAESECTDCDSVYCDSCFKVFHSMGRKRRHKQKLLSESIEDGQELCEYCSRREADCPCPNSDRDGCEVYACDSCMEFVHKSCCAKEMRESAALLSRERSNIRTSRSRKRSSSVATAGSSVSGSSHSTSRQGAGSGTGTTAAAVTDGMICAVCEEPADQICLQCQDLYCSKVWMGNSGCFAKVHGRGNRATHVIIPLKQEKPLVEAAAGGTNLPLIRKNYK